MSETLSLSEIETRYDAEWVLVGDPVTDDAFNVKEGVLLWHSKDRDEVYRKAREMHPSSSAILYTGKIPENTAVIL